MNPTVIDTLRFADRLKSSGIEAMHAEGIARALGDELADRMLTRHDLDQALGSVRDSIQAIEARLDGLDPRFDAIDTKFEAIDTKFEAMDVKFGAMDAKFGAMDAKFEALHREFSGKFNLLVGVLALGFTLLVGLGTFNAVSLRVVAPAAETVTMPPR